MSAIVRTEIRGTAYAVARLDPIRGGKLAARVGRVLAGALADQDAIMSAVEAFKGGNAADTLMDQPQLLAALAGGVKNLDAEALYDTAMEFARGNLFAGDKKLHDDTAFNGYFTEHPDHLLLVLVWVLRVNCAGFFGPRAPG